MEFSQKFFALRQRLGITQDEMAKRLGISSNYVSLLEKEKKEPSEAIIRHVELIERVENAGMSQGQGAGITLRDGPSLPAYGKKAAPERLIPVIGWAHAGLAENYEEIPEDWQDKVPSTIRDEKAFAVRLEGDSMEPKFSAGDVLILQPSLEPYNGCLAVIKMKSDGFVFRRIERRAEFVRLIPLNPQWGSEDLPLDQITWIFPVWGMWRQILK